MDPTPKPAATDGNYTERYLRYPSAREVVFVLGAGASHPDGVPLQENILPMILSGEIEEIAASVIGRQVNDFISDNFFFGPETDACPSLEAVFGFLDYFIQSNESLSARYNNARIREIKENFIKIIHYIVDLQSDKRSQVYHRFWDSIQKYNRNVSIVTLNYDTLLEQAFDFMFRRCGYIDYCIHLMNYDRLRELEAFNFWVNPREPIGICAGENPVPFKIIKLHGSLNWKYCNCCNQTLLTPWDRKIDLNRGVLIGHTFPEQVEYDYYCPIDGTEFQTLIMPPSYIKTLHNPVVSQLFGEAAREIRSTARLVFIGYSLSDADVHIKALLKKHLRPDTDIRVINTKDSRALKQQYLALSERVRFVQTSFEDLVQDDAAMEELLT
jgi:NAD-dependent SIR2 family protein deacetylase